MRRSAVGLMCALSFGPLGAAAAAPQQDPWTGAYRLEWLEGTRAAKEGAQGSDVTIQRAPDADPASLVKKYQSDLVRWTLADPSNARESTTLRRFLAREYEGWGWAGLHGDGRIECLDASHIFVCKTAPGTTITFGPEGPKRETLTAQTGVFGIVLHAGAFQLKKLEKE